MDATCRVLRYLKGTPSYVILLRSDCDLQVRAYCDADRGACPLIRRSLTKYLVTIGGSPMSWRKGELIWLKALISSLGVLHDVAM